MEVKTDDSQEHPRDVVGISIKHELSSSHMRHSFASLIVDWNSLEEANFS
jgi:hypothetical protein